MSSGPVIGDAEAIVENEARVGQRHQDELKRSGPRSNDGQQPRKRARTAGRRERSESEQAHDLADIMRALEEEFAEKERLSHGQTWCTPVSHERKVKTVEEFYKAFYDARTLPILTCKFCYRKHSRDELEEVEWDWWVESAIEKRDRSPFKCAHRFPPG